MPKAKKARKAVKKVKKAVKKVAKKAVKKAPKKVKGPKVLGMVEHFFSGISVAAVKVKAPFKVGDKIHFKGHTTDFEETIESMQIEHESVNQVKKGDDVGIKVKEHVREHDLLLEPGPLPKPKA